MQSVLGDDVTSSLVDPGSNVYGLGLGARIEVPVTRAIVSYFRPAVLSGAVWTVTLEGPVDPGDYQFVWRTSEQEPPYLEAFVPLFVASGPTGVSGGGSGTSDGSAGNFPMVDRQAVMPGVGDVAALERTRTYDADAEDQGTFNENTRPTGTEVEGLIEQATDEVLGVLSEQFDPVLYETVGRSIALQAALLVEGSYFRDNINTDVVDLYRGLVRSQLQGLQQRIETDAQEQLAASGALRLT